MRDFKTGLLYVTKPQALLCGVMYNLKQVVKKDSLFSVSKELTKPLRLSKVY